MRIKSRWRLFNRKFHAEINSNPDNIIQRYFYHFLRFLHISYTLIKESIQEFNGDKAYIQGAALSYYTIFSLPPMFYIIISIFGRFLGEDTVKHEITKELALVMGDDITKTISFFLNNLSNPDNQSLLKTIIGIGSLVFSSTIAFYTLQVSINKFWKVEEHKKEGIAQLALDRLIAFLMVISLGILVVFVIVLETVLIAALDYFKEFGFAVTWFHKLINMSLPFVLITVLFTSIFKYLPNAIIKSKDVLLGSAVTSMLFLVGQLGIGWHISQTNFSNVYGAANSIIILLAWVFYSSQIVFFGAEFIYVYANKYGSGIQPASGTTKFSIDIKKLKERFCKLFRIEEKKESETDKK